MTSAAEMNKKEKIKKQTLRILEEIKGKEISTGELLVSSGLSMKEHEEILKELESEGKIEIFEKRSWGKFVILKGD